jgi:hypothetical protein
MHKGITKAGGLAISIALVTLVLAACGSGNAGTTTQAPALSVPTANRLATLSERLATELDSGDTCHAAHSADDLQSAIESANLPASIRPSVDEVAGRLVDEVNCPPPPPPPEPDKKKQHEGDQNHQDQHHGDENKPPGHGGKLPPGKAKLKGEG